MSENLSAGPVLNSSMYFHPVPVHVAFVLKESNLNVDSISTSI